MSQVASVLVVGEVMVDVDLSSIAAGEKKLRLGGIIHACRALWALGAPYHVAYIGPSYLDESVSHYLEQHGAGRSIKLGTVTGCPSVMLVGEAREAGPQGYEYLLREQYRCEISEAALGQLSGVGASEALLFPASFPISAILGRLSDAGLRINIDAANVEWPPAEVSLEVDTVFTSTSSEQFLSHHDGDPSSYIAALLHSGAARVILKENRGGARLLDRTGVEVSVGAQLREVQHSVGVGDAFDAAFVVFRRMYSDLEALSFASWIAVEYASTTFPDDFRRGVARCLSIAQPELSAIPGARLPWEKRREFRIYIAAPDFDYLDTATVDEVERALRYHNFTPNRPVRMHGQATVETTYEQRMDLYAKDVELLAQCQLVVGICEIDDPGTMVEVGLAAGLGIPVILYDPKRRVSSPMLVGPAHEIVTTLDGLIVAVFGLATQLVEP